MSKHIPLHCPLTATKQYILLHLFLLCHGGDEEIRTPDPLLARQVLSQLSYTPVPLVLSFSGGLGRT